MRLKLSLFKSSMMGAEIPLTSAESMGEEGYSINIKCLLINYAPNEANEITFTPSLRV